MKEDEIKNRGITLIALVITIIVLLILAGVSIATLTGKNGILSQADTAKTQTEIAEEKEKVELSAVGALTKDMGGKITESNLADELTKYIGTRDIDYELAGTGPFFVKYLDSGRIYQVEENGKVSEYEDLSKYIKVGDYVEYEPDDVTTPYDKFGETYSGYVNGDIGQDDSLKWRVLNINTDGTVDLISDRPTSTEVYFKGARAYNNGVYLLNDYCKTMYSNNTIKAVARSLNIEDVQNKMKIVDEETGKKEYENYTSGTIKLKYGAKNFYSINKWYPLQWKNDNGPIGESKQETVKEYASESEAKVQETEGDLTVTQTYWQLSATVMQANFISGNTRDSEKDDSIYYELLCNNGNLSYWFASRYVTAGDESACGFGLRYIKEGQIMGTAVCGSGESSVATKSNCVRPVVTIKANIIDIDAGYDKTNGWSLK